jgi:hypothetical protein
VPLTYVYISAEQVAPREGGLVMFSVSFRLNRQERLMKIHGGSSNIKYLSAGHFIYFIDCVHLD